MKRIFCPKCDTEIVITPERVAAWREEGLPTTSLLCPTCTYQIKIRLKSGKSKQAEAVGKITVLENVFGEKQEFLLSLGENKVGRRNKDSVTDIPIITGDPSMDRHHAIIKVQKTKKGKLKYYVADDESRVGTFVSGDIIAPKEWRIIEDGDVITLGATSLILSGKEQED